MTVIKTEVYDKFHCIADKCPMTCCQGWTIKVDNNTYEKWKSHQDTAYLCGYVNSQNEEEETLYDMKTDDTKTCLLLDSQGLCELVKKHGDGYLCDTCAHFPRKRNEITRLDANDEEQVIVEEYSLSGACPAVMELLWKCEGSLKLELTGECGSPITFPMEYQIRNALICMVQGEGIYGGFSLEERLMLGFSLLHECLDCETEENVYDCLGVYAEKENLIEITALWDEVSVSEEEALDELCQTFWNVTEYYKEEPMYCPYLFSLAQRIDSWYPEEDTQMARKLRREACKAWQSYKKEFAKYDTRIQSVIAAEIFADCISDDIVALIESYQAIVFEYIMTRMSVFLLGKMSDADVKRYFSLFIRVIGHNTEGMAEYWEENFEDSVLDKEYFYLLLQ